MKWKLVTTIAIIAILTTIIGVSAYCPPPSFPLPNVFI
jgi:hypothetical protein